MHAGNARAVAFDATGTNGSNANRALRVLNEATRLYALVFAPTDGASRISQFANGARA
jgi:hypothetical protein